MALLVHVFLAIVIGVGYLLYLIISSIYKDIKEKEYNKKHPSRKITVDDIFKWFPSDNPNLDDEEQKK